MRHEVSVTKSTDGNAAKDQKAEHFNNQLPCSDLDHMNANVAQDLRSEPRCPEFVNP